MTKLSDRRRRRRLKPHRKVDNNVCRELLREVWQLDWQFTPKYAGVPPNSYLGHWEDCIVAAGDDPTLSLEEHVVAISLTRIIKDSLDKQLDEIQNDFRSNYPVQLTSQLSDEQVQTAVSFATSLWLHISLDFSSPSLTFKQAVRNCVPEKTDPKSITGELSHDFCAKHLSRKTGISIDWTDKIEEHLTCDESSIKVFRSYSMLLAVQRQPQRDPFPPGFVNETIQTLYLLFRPLEHARWNIKRMEKHQDIDLEFAISEWQEKELKEYPYWHHHLAAIQKLYDRKRPTTLRQWFFDRRDRAQWATFWVAFVVFVLTVIFGIISSITSILQVYAAYHPL
ncbi:hypothetical protein LTR05_005334 [Lithohypha guttulata]|uniref:Uncharacterized protein n=1 Tax=Lithohypha guttulata TaxID=1690604 RepID=A0AAN7SXL7_9EURO|nr:hypothetical protein LTR05_005334 [Lithohypha guttulata]